MPARVEEFPLPHRSTWRAFGPFLGWAFLATLFALIWRAARQPSLPKMSDEWLLSRQQDFARDDS